MAKISGKDVGLYVNQGTTETPDWFMFACSTSDGFSGSTDTVDLASKCDEGFIDRLPTNLSWEFSNSSYAVTDDTLGVAQVSYDTAFDLWSNRTITEFKIANVDETYYRAGKGFISSLSDAAGNDEGLTFDLTISGLGIVTNVPPVVV